ncbi:hypothetical protein BJ742DRAFT_868441 [Cladochytrium replicatum]|nr:hypothetical protein BJ742DRAFT_868441 [Cladochytrium replicatum]
MDPKVFLENDTRIMKFILKKKSSAGLVMRMGMSTHSMPVDLSTSLQETQTIPRRYKLGSLSLTILKMLDGRLAVWFDVLSPTCSDIHSIYARIYAADCGPIGNQRRQEIHKKHNKHKVYRELFVERMERLVMKGVGSFSECCLFIATIKLVNKYAEAFGNDYPTAASPDLLKRKFGKITHILVVKTKFFSLEPGDVRKSAATRTITTPHSRHLCDNPNPNARSVPLIAEATRERG